jgi:hypothetical protein
MKKQMKHILSLSVALLFILPGMASAEEAGAHFDSLLVTGADLEPGWTEGEAATRVAELTTEVIRLRGAAQSDLARNLYSMAEQRFRSLADRLQEEISLLEILANDAGTELVRDAATLRLTDASRERDGAVDMVQLLALR